MEETTGKGILAHKFKLMSITPSPIQPRQGSLKLTPHAILI
jgi:hypothetical protein